MNKTPQRGDVLYADLSGIEQSIGSEQTGKLAKMKNVEKGQENSKAIQELMEMAV